MRETNGGIASKAWDAASFRRRAARYDEKSSPAAGLRGRIQRTNPKKANGNGKRDVLEDLG